jgi:hypothetical protein
VHADLSCLSFRDRCPKLSVLTSRCLSGVTTRKCADCPAREAAAMLCVQQFELEHDFQGASEVAKVAVYRKALFRDRNQTRKHTLFTLEPRPDALRGVFQPLTRRKFTLSALNCPIWVLSNRTILTLSCRHPAMGVLSALGGSYE